LPRKSKPTGKVSARPSTPPSAVVDATILVSAFLTPYGIAAQLLAEARQGGFSLVLSEEILAETQEVLVQRARIRKRYAYTDEQPLRFCHALRTAVPLVRPAPGIRGVCRDPNDDHVIACAVAAHAPYVTRDPDLLILRTYQDVQMVSPGMFSQLLVRGKVTPDEDG
jgi:putative PIN family toxin of toxin-antitoxin system